jgi:phage baseplate assembly protein W
MATGIGFPFGVSPDGAIAAAADDDADLRGKIIQVLCTAPGERVNHPDFGCGLFNLVFDPGNTILGAAIEFTVGAALTRWLGELLVVDGVSVTVVDEAVAIEVAYVSRHDLSHQAVRIRFR